MPSMPDLCARLDLDPRLEVDGSEHHVIYRLGDALVVSLHGTFTDSASKRWREGFLREVELRGPPRFCAIDTFDFHTVTTLRARFETASFGASVLASVRECVIGAGGPDLVVVRTILRAANLDNVTLVDSKRELDARIATHGVARRPRSRIPRAATSSPPGRSR